MKTVVFLVLLSCGVFIVSGQQVQLTRSNPNVMGTNDLVLTCSLSGSSGLKTDGLISMQLSKNTSSIGNFNNIVSITSASADYNWQDTFMENRDGVSVTGLNTKGNIQTATLTLTVDRHNTTCQDSGVYFCVVTAFKNDDSLFVETGTATVEITSISASAALSVSPFSSSGLSLYQYQVGTTLNFTCTSNVGTNQVIHRWCYKRPSDVSLTQPSTTTGIIQNTGGLVQVDGCNWRRTSYFEYNVSSLDTTTVILCEPNRPGSAYSLCNSTGFAKSFTITNNVDSGNTAGQGDAGGSAEPENAGMIAGTVIGVFAGVLLIALIIYFVVVRRRNPGETYNTKEDGSPENADNGGPAHMEGPVYSVPDKNRQRGKRGHENKAMDEPRDEKRHHHEDRDGRGHTNRAMYNDYDDRYDSDQDGDVMRGSQDGGGHPIGIGSAV